MGNRQITAQGSQDPRPYLQVLKSLTPVLFHCLLFVERFTEIHLSRENRFTHLSFQLIPSSFLLSLRCSIFSLESLAISGNGKFMKSYLMKVDDTSVLVKVYFKSVDEDLETYAATLTWMWNALSPSQHPNLLPYQMWVKSSVKVSKPNLSPIFLVRQYFPYNLYDRLSTRPFVSDLEKLWIIYQLMRAVEEAHEEGVVHGDLKPENVMVTSWNWIVLTDFAPYKPVMIPDDDPTDFHYFFDSMGRRRCYIAPERFYKSTLTKKSKEDAPSNASGENQNSKPTSSPDILRASMDVFSLGCTIAEVGYQLYTNDCH